LIIQRPRLRANDSDRCSCPDGLSPETSEPPIGRDKAISAFCVEGMKMLLAGQLVAYEVGPAPDEVIE
jgi:hypothetical protein